jgi:hypothetical protein
VTELLPLALNPDYDGHEVADRDRNIDLNSSAAKKTVNYAEMGDTLVMVLDVRRAIAVVGSDVDAVVAFLGGGKPYTGARRVYSNAAARAVTSHEWDGD